VFRYPSPIIYNNKVCFRQTERHTSNPIHVYTRPSTRQAVKFLSNKIGYCQIDRNCSSIIDCGERTIILLKSEWDPMIIDNGRISPKTNPIDSSG